MTFFARLEERACRVSAWLDRHPLWAFTVVGLLNAAAMLSMAAAKPLWHDEIFTVVLAGLPAADLWTATVSGVDLSPPLNTLLTHLAMSVAGNGHVAVRVVPLVGFAAAVAIVFEFVRRRSNTATAMAAALLPGFTAGLRYSYEARGYGLMMGFAALSLFAWAEAAAGRRRQLHLPLLALALAAGYWTHFYGLFAAAPLIGGELARAFSTRKVDTGIWAALGLSFLALLPLAALIDAGGSLAPTFWARARLTDLLPTYTFLLNALLEPAFLAGAAALILAATLGRALGLPHPRRRPLPGHEVAALALSVALPAIQIVVALGTTGVFVPRYALAAVPGLCITIALVMGRVAPARLAQLAAAAALAVSFALSAPFRPSFPHPARQRPALMGLLGRGHPVVIPGGLMYLQVWYYTPPGMRRHLYYLGRPDAALQRTGSDTIDRGLLQLARWTDLNVIDPDPFVRAHPEFFVYAAGSGWVVEWLREGSAHIEQRAAEGGSAILAVRTAPREKGG